MMSYDAGLATAILTASLKAAPALLVNGIRRPVETLSAVGSAVASVYRTVRPISQPGSPIMRDRGKIRRLAALNVSTKALHRAGAVAGGSLNDAFIAAITGGLRRYHEKHGKSVGDLSVSMPISLRTDDDPVGGNRVTLMRFDVPAAITDPAQRIRDIHDRTNKVRSEKSLSYTQPIAGMLNSDAPLVHRVGTAARRLRGQ